MKWSFDVAAAALLASLSLVACDDGVHDGPSHSIQPAPEKHTSADGNPAWGDNFSELVDHFAPPDASPRFNQRFFVDSTYAKTADAPVFLWICAEGGCSADQMRGAVGAPAAKFGGHMVALEHRYYGKSFPVTDLTTPNMRFLSVEQSLADLTAFIQSMREVQGLTGPWVTAGGSYSGSLSAYMRATHPELVSAALASSAPVQAKESFDEYDAHIAQILGADCAAKTRVVVAQIDATMASDAAGFEDLKTAFGVDPLADPAYFGATLSYLLGGMAQYGNPTKEDYCAAVSAADPVKGLASLTKGVGATSSILASGHDVAGLNLLANDGSNPMNTEIPDEATTGGRMWLYQTCTQFGYWPVANHDRAVSVYSKYLTLEYYRGICNLVFGLTTPANAQALNDKYYSALINGQATKILFTNGSEDPWSELSMASPAVKSQEFAYRVEGGHHCDDVLPEDANDSASLKGARAKFQSLLGGWLRK